MTVCRSGRASQRGHDLQVEAVRVGMRLAQPAVAQRDKEQRVILAKRLHDPAQVGHVPEGLGRKILAARERAAARAQLDDPAPAQRCDGTTSDRFEQRLGTKVRRLGVRCLRFGGDAGGSATPQAEHGGELGLCLLACS